MAISFLGAEFPFVQATGGTETTFTRSNVTYKVHTFTSSGTFTVSTAGEASILLVAGGGGGGVGGGGGGAGGVLYNDAFDLSETSYSIVIGSGGTGGTNTPSAPNGAKGTDTTGFGVTALGGGGGNQAFYGDATQTVKAGGSGGGGGVQYSGTVYEPGAATQADDGTFIGYGHAGGVGGAYSSPYMGGGGGGAGGAGGWGFDHGYNELGVGGDGICFDITGNTTFYAGGGGAGDSAVIRSGGLGGGGAGSISSSGSAGTVNTGGGGGAGGSGGGNGGSGIVIICYAIS
jgi:hypothetical protein